MEELFSGTPERDFGESSTLFGDFKTADDAVLRCRLASSVNFPGWTKAGFTWFWAGKPHALYTHAQVPNGQVPDCLNQRVLHPGEGVVTARSWHLGGVNVVAADGSLRFVSESIALNVWRALGTRNGGELVE